MSGTTAIDRLKDCDLVIEAIIENLEEKRRTYAALEQIVSDHTILLSNTSSLCITELAAATKRPDRFGGLHFFNPVPLMKLVEVIRALTTSDGTYQTVFAFAQSLGKEPITAPDRPGFIVNRLLVPYLLDAIRAYENGLGTVEDIDKGMKLGCGYPMGPFTLLDFVGLDTTYYIANIMFEEFREPAYAPPPLLKRMVLAGAWGARAAGDSIPTGRREGPRFSSIRAQHGDRIERATRVSPARNRHRAQSRRAPPPRLRASPDRWPRRRTTGSASCASPPRRARGRS